MKTDQITCVSHLAWCLAHCKLQINGVIVGDDDDVVTGIKL